MIAISLLCLFAATANKPGSGHDKKQAVQQNFKPVVFNCLLPPNQQLYAFRNSCVASNGNICVATMCEGYPVENDKKPSLVNCVRNGKIYAIVNKCVDMKKAVCRDKVCPPAS